MISTIVFDVGDVLVDFRYEDHMRDLGFREDAVRTLAENMVLTDFWGEMDLGIRTEQDAVEKFCRELPQLRQEVIRFWQNTQGLVREYSYAQPLLHSLKELGYRVYVLSNYPTETAKRHWPTFRFLSEADGYLISGFEKIAKPDPRFYRLLEERFDVKLSECLFIDDREKNIDGAKAVGMQGLLFTGYEKLLKDLEELGIRVNPE